MIELARSLEASICPISAFYSIHLRLISPRMTLALRRPGYRAAFRVRLVLTATSKIEILVLMRREVNTAAGPKCRDGCAA